MVSDCPDGNCALRFDGIDDYLEAPEPLASWVRQEILLLCRQELAAATTRSQLKKLLERKAYKLHPTATALIEQAIAAKTQ